MSVGPRILLLVVSVVGVVPVIVEEGVPDDEDGFSNMSNIDTSALFPNSGGTDIHNQALSLSLPKPSPRPSNQERIGSTLRPIRLQ